MFFPLGLIKCLDFEKKKELLVHLNICPIEKKCCFFCKYFRKKLTYTFINAHINKCTFRKKLAYIFISAHILINVNIY